MYQTTNEVTHMFIDKYLRIYQTTDEVTRMCIDHVCNSHVYHWITKVLTCIDVNVYQSNTQVCMCINEALTYDIIAKDKSPLFFVTSCYHHNYYRNIYHSIKSNLYIWYLLVSEETPLIWIPRLTSIFYMLTRNIIYLSYPKSHILIHILIHIHNYFYYLFTYTIQLISIFLAFLLNYL